VVAEVAKTPNEILPIKLSTVYDFKAKVIEVSIENTSNSAVIIREKALSNPLMSASWNFSREDGVWQGGGWEKSGTGTFLRDSIMLGPALKLEKGTALVRQIPMEKWILDFKDKMSNALANNDGITISIRLKFLNLIKSEPKIDDESSVLTLAPEISIGAFKDL